MTINGGGSEKGFHVFATQAAYWVGTKWAFLAALFVVLGWLVAGPYFHYSDTWQLVINTGTTVVTFLVVFLIQNTQNRDATAIHLKLDEIIKSIDKARSFRSCRINIRRSVRNATRGSGVGQNLLRYSITHLLGQSRLAQYEWKVDGTTSRYFLPFP